LVSSERRSALIVAATANALIAGVSRVPDLMSRSWPPPAKQSM